MKNTPWVVVTGLDGSGKTTLVANLEKWFNESGYRVKRSRLPYDQHLVKDLLNVSKDAYTDRMLFALDNRLFGVKLEEWDDSNNWDVILTQRGYLDSFVHGAVQGFSYDWINNLNQFQNLPKCDIMIHLVAEADVAYARIKNDPDADKFETPNYIKVQEFETRLAYERVSSKSSSELEIFSNTKNIFIDTTNISTDETFEIVKQELRKL